MKNVTLIVKDKQGREKRYPVADKAEANRRANTEFKGLRCQVQGGRGNWESGRTRRARSYSDMMMVKGGY